jgi:hypothetical protein
VVVEVDYHSNASDDEDAYVDAYGDAYVDDEAVLVVHSCRILRPSWVEISSVLVDDRTWVVPSSDPYWAFSHSLEAASDAYVDGSDRPTVKGPAYLWMIEVDQKDAASSCHWDPSDDGVASFCTYDGEEAVDWLDDED